MMRTGGPDWSKIEKFELTNPWRDYYLPASHVESNDYYRKYVWVEEQVSASCDETQDKFKVCSQEWKLKDGPSWSKGPIITKEMTLIEIAHFHMPVYKMLLCGPEGIKRPPPPQKKK